MANKKLASGIRTIQIAHNATYPAAAQIFDFSTAFPAGSVIKVKSVKTYYDSVTAVAESSSYEPIKGSFYGTGRYQPTTEEIIGANSKCPQVSQLINLSAFWNGTAVQKVFSGLGENQVWFPQQDIDMDGWYTMSLGLNYLPFANLEFDTVYSLEIEYEVWQIDEATKVKLLTLGV